jgi:hypothetical protein
VGRGLRRSGGYTEQLDGYERMLHKHVGLGITNEQRFRFASLMSLAADDAGMPADPEFRSALVAYLEWGTRLALGNSQPGATVTEHAPVPPWGWGEAPPYKPQLVTCDNARRGSPSRCVPAKGGVRPTEAWAKATGRLRVDGRS